MESVGSSKLKNSLNSYLARIKRGARFIVTDRGQPIAKLVPINDVGDDSLEGVLSALVAEGLISIEAGLGVEALTLGKPVVKLRGDRAARAIVEDRRRE